MSTTESAPTRARRRPVVRGAAALVVGVIGVTITGCSSDAATDATPDTSPDTVADSAPSSDVVPVGTDPAVTEPADTDPAATEPADTEPVDADPADTGVADTEPADTEPAGRDFSAVGPIVADFVAERGLNGAGLVVVDAEDGVVHEEYWGEFGPDRISLVASSTKMVTAGVLLALQDEGRLDIDEPVAAVAEWGAGNPDVTPAQLVSNSSGLVGLGPNPTYGPYLCQFLPAGSLQECAATVFQTPDDDGDIVAPDTEFRYGGAQWQVAGAVAEVVSGETWAELIDRIYVEPCGLESTGYNNHFAQIGSGFEYPVEFVGDPSTLVDTANPNMEGGMYTTTGDYAELLLMHLRGGRCGDTQVLSEAAVDTMHADRIAAVYDGTARADTGYGMGWWVDRTTGRISDPGAYGSVPWLDLDDGYGAYLVVEADSGTGNELAALLYDEIETAVLAGR